jgi:hypothetical protein
MLLAQVMRAEMPMEIRRCAAGGHAFRPRPQVPQQRYCSAAACQRERRRRWQRDKRESDPDYCENQARAQRAWAQNHGEYWREYRRLHPQYCEHNRNAARQRQRDRRRRATVATEFAKMDASLAGSRVPSGTYRLVPAGAERFAKMDACLVEITLVSMPYAQPGGEGGSLQREDVIGAVGER